MLLEANAKVKESRALLDKYAKDNFSVGWNTLEIIGLTTSISLLLAFLSCICYFCYKHQTIKRIQTFLVSPEYQPAPKNLSRSSSKGTLPRKQLADEERFGKGAVTYSKAEESVEMYPDIHSAPKTLTTMNL